MACYKPLVLGSLVVPCGKCEGCLHDKRKVLLRSTSNHTQRGVFFTLTYSDDFVPRINGKSHFVYRHSGEIIPFSVLSKKSLEFGINVPDSPQMVLLRYDIVNFLKRLRKYIFKEVCNENDELYKTFRLSYFICGEYSPKLRPHYHGILYTDYPESFSIEDYSYRWLKWQSPKIAKWISANWPFCPQYRITRFTTETTNSACSNYCAKYLSKSYCNFKNFLFFSPFAKRSRLLGESTSSLRRMYSVFFSSNGSYIKFISHPDSNSYNSPSLLLRFLGKPYDFNGNNLFTTYSRLKSILFGYIPKDLVHCADLQCLRSYRHFVSNTSWKDLSLYDFLILLDRFYYSRSMFSLKKQYCEYKLCNYEITINDLIFSTSDKHIKTKLHNVLTSLNCSFLDFYQASKEVSDKYHRVMSDAFVQTTLKYYPFEK